jgi:hypothetical protein
MQGEAEEFCGVGPGEVDGLGFLGFGRSGHNVWAVEDGCRIASPGGEEK